MPLNGAVAKGNRMAASSGPSSLPNNSSNNNSIGNRSSRETYADGSVVGSGSSGAGGGGSSTTILKYEKSSCLFCNEWFDSQTFTEHLIHCGQVLEECPNSCHVFVPRIRMRTHLKECPRSKQSGSGGGVRPATSSTSLPATVSQERLDTISSVSEARLLGLEQDVSTLRSVLNEEIRQRLHLITDVGSLRKQNQVADDWTHTTEEALRGFRKQLDEENEQRCFEVEQCHNDFRYYYDAVQTIKMELVNEMKILQQHINSMSVQVVDHENQLNENILKLEETVLLHEKLNRDKFIEVEDFLGTISNDLKTKFVANSDLNAKQVTMDYEVKSMKNIVCETEERCEKLETQVRQITQTLCDLENHLATQQRLAGIQNSRGHLLWRIKDYSKKLEEAKQFDTILHSAMFSNKPYGYAVRLDIHLNGRGTWKGRNMLACLNVIPGEYDPLLNWPCRLQADVIIKAQSMNGETGQDYVKTIQVRKKSDEYFQSNQYFHIPHKVIQTGEFLRNDCLYVEVKVLK